MVRDVLARSLADDGRALSSAGGSRGLLVTLVGRYACHRDRAVASSTVVEVLGGCGVQEHAARSLLVRMVQRGWLERHRLGRRSYLRPTAELATRLQAGRRRIYHREPVIGSWPGDWTLLSFSVPEQRRSDRHRVRSLLRWEGFAPLRSGLWITPGDRPLDGRIGTVLEAGDGHGFRADLRAPSDPAGLLERAWDLDELAQVYRGFLGRWQGPPAPRGDTLARHLHLIADWRRVLRAAPPLPAALVPSGWPAVPAWEQFHRLEQALGPVAERAYAELRETIPVSEAAAAPVGRGR